MGLDQASAIAQIIASIAVIVSLIYVGIQIRQNTRTTRLAAVQAVQEAIGRTEELIIGNAEFAEILRSGLNASTADLPDTHRIRLNIFYRNALRAYQAAHYQHRQGALDDSVWEPQAMALAAIFQADRGLREHFAVEKYMLDPSFVALCEQLLLSGRRWRLTSAHKPLATGHAASVGPG
jgi:hypothetical protein